MRMELVNKELLLLEKKLMSFVVNRTDIGIHYRCNDTIIRESFVLDNYVVNETTLHLFGDWFQITVKSKITNVLFDEDEDVIYVEFSDGTEINIETY